MYETKRLHLLVVTNPSILNGPTGKTINLKLPIGYNYSNECTLFDSIANTNKYINKIPDNNNSLWRQYKLRHLHGMQ